MAFCGSISIRLVLCQAWTAPYLPGFSNGQTLANGSFVHQQQVYILFAILVVVALDICGIRIAAFLVYSRLYLRGAPVVQDVQETFYRWLGACSCSASVQLVFVISPELIAAANDLVVCLSDTQQRSCSPDIGVCGVVEWTDVFKWIVDFLCGVVTILQTYKLFYGSADFIFNHTMFIGNDSPP